MNEEELWQKQIEENEKYSRFLNWYYKKLAEDEQRMDDEDIV